MFDEEPTWRDISFIRDDLVPQEKVDWLEDPGSLTSKLMNACEQDGFQVHLLSEQWQPALKSEMALLGMASEESALVREVRLLCGDKPWVFARTVIPRSSFIGKAKGLANLKDKPLGALLFSDPSTVRQSMQFAQLMSGHVLFEQAKNKEDEVLWGRRTLFYYANKPLLVNEIFLSTIPHLS